MNYQQELANIKKTARRLLTIFGSILLLGIAYIAFMASTGTVARSTLSRFFAVVMMLGMFVSVYGIPITLFWRHRKINKLEKQYPAAAARHLEDLQSFTEEVAKRKKHRKTIGIVVTAVGAIAGLLCGGLPGVLLGAVLTGFWAAIIIHAMNKSTDNHLRGAVRSHSRHDFIEALRQKLPEAEYHPEQKINPALLQPLYTESFSQVIGSDLISAVYKGYQVTISDMELWHDIGEDATHLLNGYAVVVKTGLTQPTVTCQSITTKRDELDIRWVYAKGNDEAMGARRLPDRWVRQTARALKYDLRVGHLTNGWLVLTVNTGNHLLRYDSTTITQEQLQQNAAENAERVFQIVDAVMSHPALNDPYFT